MLNLKHFADFLKLVTNPAKRREYFYGASAENPFPDVEKQLREMAKQDANLKYQKEQLKRAQSQPEALSLCDMIDKIEAYQKRLLSAFKDEIATYDNDGIADLKRYIDERNRFFKSVKAYEIHDVPQEVGEPNLNADRQASEITAQVEKEKAAQFSPDIYNEDSNIKKDSKFADLEFLISGYETEQTLINRPTKTIQEFEEEYNGNYLDEDYARYLEDEKQDKMYAQERIDEYLKPADTIKEMIAQNKYTPDEIQRYLQTRKEYFEKINAETFAGKVENGSIVFPEGVTANTFEGLINKNEMDAILKAHDLMQQTFDQALTNNVEKDDE